MIVIVWLRAIWQAILKAPRLLNSRNSCKKPREKQPQQQQQKNPTDLPWHITENFPPLLDRCPRHYPLPQPSVRPGLCDEVQCAPACRTSIRTAQGLSVRVGQQSRSLRSRGTVLHPRMGTDTIRSCRVFRVHLYILYWVVIRGALQG